MQPHCLQTPSIHRPCCSQRPPPTYRLHSPPSTNPLVFSPRQQCPPSPTLSPFSLQVPMPLPLIGPPRPLIPLCSSETTIPPSPAPTPPPFPISSISHTDPTSPQTASPLCSPSGPTPAHFPSRPQFPPFRPQSSHTAPKPKQKPAPTFPTPSQSPSPSILNSPPHNTSQPSLLPPSARSPFSPGSSP